MYTISVAVLRNEGEEPALVAKLQRELANHTGSVIGPAMSLTLLPLHPVPPILVRAGEMAVTLTYSVQPLALGN